MSAATSPVPTIEFRSVTTEYEIGKPVFRGLSTTITGPGLIAVRGGNGVGKSTLLELCSGYLQPTSGEVLLDGTTAHSAAARAGRRMCRAHVALLPEMTARDHLVLAARSHGLDPSGPIDRARAYGMGPWLEHRSKNLSNGNRRKLWLVMCTVGRARHVLLDEPFQGLDDESIEVLLDEIRQLRAHSLIALVAHDWPDRLQPDGDIVLAGAMASATRTGHEIDVQEAHR